MTEFTVTEVFALIRGYRDDLDHEPTIEDYESCKRILHKAGIYGYEKDIADMLGV